MCESCGCGRAPSDGGKPAPEGAHEHWHVHADGTAHFHPHEHAEGGAHRLHRHVHRTPPLRPRAAEQEVDAAESSTKKDEAPAVAGPPQD
jgi:hypothetical protein